MPPRLAAYYKESWEDGLAGWTSPYGCPTGHRRDGKASPGYVRYTEQPLLNDFNHEACGVLHLMTSLKTGKASELSSPAAALGGGNADLRGARLSLWLRGTEWRPNGSEFLVWVQSQINIELGDRPGWRRANWCYNGFYLTGYLLAPKRAFLARYLKRG